jgi:hypothetical protein
MAQHKWHKEIKAWADGAEIQIKYLEGAGSKSGWMVMGDPDWDCYDVEYRIKPQPKEPQYINVYGWLENGNITFKQYGPYLGKIKLEVDDE